MLAIAPVALGAKQISGPPGARAGRLSAGRAGRHHRAHRRATGWAGSGASRRWSRTLPAPAATSPADRVAKSTPDGYTLLVSTNAQLVVNPSLYKMTFDPAKDLMPISLAVYSPNILVVPNDVPAKSVKELVEYLRAQSGQELCLGRRRHHAAPCRRTVQVDGAGRHPARALSRRGAGHHRPAGRAHHHVLRRHLAADSAGAAKANCARSPSPRRSAFRATPDLPTMIEAGYPGLCLDPLDRPDGAGRHAARDRRENSPGLR